MENYIILHYILHDPEHFMYCDVHYILDVIGLRLRGIPYVIQAKFHYSDMACYMQARALAAPGRMLLVVITGIIVTVSKSYVYHK